MGRLNLTLDDDTLQSLERHGRRMGKPLARTASELIRDGLARVEVAERRRVLARDYAAGRRDAAALLRDLEAGQLGLLEDEDA
jgi:hypothetical protein